MYTLIIILIVIVSVLLVIIILAQNPKGGGLSSQFGGSGASNLIGVKQTGDLLEKLTWGFAITIALLSLTVHFTVTPANTPESSIIDRAKKEQTIPDLDLGDAFEDNNEKNGNKKLDEEQNQP